MNGCRGKPHQRADAVADAVLALACAKKLQVLTSARVVPISSAPPGRALIGRSPTDSSTWCAYREVPSSWGETIPTRTSLTVKVLSAR